MMLQPHEDYFLLVGPDDAYLLLKGTERLIEALSEYMPHKELVPKRYGPTNYIPANGRKYDWFVKVEKPDGSKPSWREIAEFFAYYSEEGVRRYEEHIFREMDFLYDKIKRSYETIIECLEEERDEYEDELERISIALGIAGTPLSNLADEINLLSLGRDHSEERDAEIERLEEERDDYEEALERISIELDIAGTPYSDLASELSHKAEQDREQITNEISVEVFETIVKPLLDRTDQEMRTARNASEAFEEVFSEKEDLETELIVVSEELELQKRRAAKRQSKDTPTLIQSVLPGVEFIWDSLAVVFDEFSDPLPALSRVGEIVFEQVELNPVAATSGWYELHCSTGKKHDGRIYFTKVGKDRKRMVYISRKQRQEQDIERLKQNPAR